MTEGKNIGRTEAVLSAVQQAVTVFYQENYIPPTPLVFKRAPDNQINDFLKCRLRKIVDWKGPVAETLVFCYSNNDGLLTEKIKTVLHSDTHLRLVIVEFMNSGQLRMARDVVLASPVIDFEERTLSFSRTEAENSGHDVLVRYKVLANVPYDDDRHLEQLINDNPTVNNLRQLRDSQNPYLRCLYQMAIVEKLFPIAHHYQAMEALKRKDVREALMEINPQDK